MHLYPVLHAWLAQDDRCLDLYGGRLSRHLGDYARLFGADGAPMHQGRSLTYRFATTAPLWLGALTGHTPLPPGETRRLASGALKYFLDRGAVGLPRPAHPRLARPRPGGPAGLFGPGLAVLGEQGLPRPAPPGRPRGVDGGGGAGPGRTRRRGHPIAAPNWLLQSTRSDGLVRLHNHGSEDVRYDPYYTRLAYSTVTGPSASYDNSLILGGDPSRTEIEPLGVGEGWAASRHVAAGGARVSSVVLARGAVEVRAFLVAGAEPGTSVRVTGWAARDGRPGRTAARRGPGRDADRRHRRGPTLFVALSRLTGSRTPRRWRRP